MKKTKLLPIIVSTLMLQSPLAFGGYYRSSIEGISFDDADLGEPSILTIQKFSCADYAPGGSRKDADLLVTCQNGVTAAYSVANKYAKGEGSYLGCIDGFQQGIARGFNEKRNPSVQMLKQAKKRYSNTEMQTAVTRAKSKASNDSNYSTEGEIIKRFRSVVRTSSTQQVQAPSDDYSDILTIPNFQGFNDGYTTDSMGGNFNDVIRSGWVKSSDRIERRIQARAVKKHFGTRNILSDSCSQYPTLFDTSLHTVSLWDFFSAYGEYNFKDYGWKSTDRSWIKLVNKSISNENFIYHGIQPVMEDYVVTTGYHKKPQPRMKDEVITNPDGTTTKTGKKIPVLDANGVPVIDMVDDKTRPITEVRQRAVAGKSKKDLQRIFEDGFKTSYQRFARVLFAREFLKMHKISRSLGETAGNAIGVIVAQDIADQLAYNEKYQSDSRAEYAREYEKLFVDSWNTNFDYFMNNPMVEILDFATIGKDNDGIFKRGEMIRPVLRLRNLGLQSGKVNVLMSGAAINNASKKVGSIVASPSLEFNYDTSSYLASLKPDLRLLNRTEVNVAIDGPAISQVYRLKSTDSEAILINDVAEIHGTKTELNPIQGNGTVFARIKNPSKSLVNVIDVELVLSNGAKFNSSLTNLGAEDEDKAFPIQFDSVDPLYILNKGGISGEVVTRVAGQKIHSGSFSTSVDRSNLLSDYYFAVINNETSNYGGEAKGSRKASLHQMIVERTRIDIKRDTKWSNPSSVNSTVLGKILLAKKKAIVAGNMSESAQQDLNVLANELNKIYKKVFGYDDYLKLLNELSSVPLEEIGKKDRK